MVRNEMLLNIVKVMLIFLAALVALGLITVFVIMPSVIRGETVEVPNVRGLSLWEASSKLAQVGLRFELAPRRFDPAVPEDHVILQSPPASVNIRKDRPVKLTLSLGAEKVEVPNLVHKRKEDVESVLQAAGFALGRTVHVYDDNTPIPGTVLAQSPLPQSVGKRGQAIDLLVSDGVRPKLLVMPNLRKTELAKAQKLLHNQGLTTDVSYEMNSILPSGQVIQHTPGPRQYVRVGQTVELVVSGSSRTGAQQQRQLTVRHRVSPGENMKHVRMVVEDGLGAREILNENYAPGTILSKPVVVTGDATLRVYEDNMQQPVREEKL